MKDRITLATALALLIAVASTAPQVAAQEEDGVESALYRAYYLETALGDLEGAAALFADAAARSETVGDTVVLSQAHLGRARCLAGLGRLDEARQLAERALALDPEQKEARLLLARLAGGPEAQAMELESRIERLVARLGGPERESAAKDLLLVGDLAVPPLARALRSKEVGQVQSAAAILIDLCSDSAIDALGAAAADGSIVFPHVIVDELLDRGVKSQLLRAWLAYFPVTDDTRRRELALQVCVAIGEHELADDETLRAFFAAAAADPRPEVRAALLGDGWPPGLRPRLLEIARDRLRDGSPDDRLQTLRFARQLGGEERAQLAEAMLPLIGDPDERVRRTAVDLLVDADRDSKSFTMGAEVGRRACLQALGSDDLRVCDQALRGLDRAEVVPDPELVEGIVLALRRAASRADVHMELEPLGRAVARGVLDLDRQIELFEEFASEREDRAGRAFERSVARVFIGTMERRVGQDPSWERDLAARGLERIRGERAREQWIGSWLSIRPDAEVLAAALASDSDGLRSNAYDFYLGPFRGTASTQAEEERLDVLRRTPPPEGFPRLGKDLLDGEGSTRLAGTALRLVSRFPSPELGGALRRCHDLVTGSSRAQALRALVSSVGADAADVLRRDLRDTSLEVVDLASASLLEQLGEEAIPDLVAVARERRRPGWLLNSIGRTTKKLESSPELLAAYVGALETDELDSSFVEFCAGFLEPEPLAALLSRCLTSGRADLQELAARRAGISLVQDLWDQLVPLLEAPEPAVQREAMLSLQALRAHRQMRAELALLDRSGARSALEEATAMLESDDPLQRRGAALALGALGDPAAVPALLRLLKDDDPSVRDAALTALERLAK